MVKVDADGAAETESAPRDVVECAVAELTSLVVRRDGTGGMLENLDEGTAPAHPRESCACFRMIFAYCSKNARSSGGGAPGRARRMVLGLRSEKRTVLGFWIGTAPPVAIATRNAV